jgi:hypothetical protein
VRGDVALPSFILLWGGALLAAPLAVGARAPIEAGLASTLGWVGAPACLGSASLVALRARRSPARAVLWAGSAALAALAALLVLAPLPLAVVVLALAGMVAAWGAAMVAGGVLLVAWSRVRAVEEDAFGVAG